MIFGRDDLPDGEVWDRPIHLHPRYYTVDHVVPLVLGGTDSVENTRGACRACNRAKYMKPLHEVQPIRRSASLRH